MRYGILNVVEPHDSLLFFNPSASYPPSSVFTSSPPPTAVLPPPVVNPNEICARKKNGNGVATTRESWRKTIFVYVDFLELRDSGSFQPQRQRVCCPWGRSEGVTVFETDVEFHVAWEGYAMFSGSRGQPEGAVQLAQYPLANSYSKHIDVSHSFFRELVHQGDVSVTHAPSEYQHADILTKAGVFVAHRKILMNVSD